MKSLFQIAVLVFLTSATAFGQIKTPAASPSCKMTQTVGLTDVTIEYSSPSVKGRTIFGDLVPYDKIWRLGANQATKMTFSTDINIGGQDLEKGSYAVLATPSKNSWSVMFYPFEESGFGAYVEKTPVATAVAKTMPMGEVVESFMVMIDNLRNNSADLYFLWDKTMAMLPITVKAGEMVQANIDKVMAGPSAGDYYNAAGFYLSEGKNLDDALTWMNKSIEMGNDRFWTQRRKSEILAGLGKYKEAIMAAKVSMKMATEAGNNDYVKINTKNIAKWTKM